MAGRLQSKVALVTGGASGIGRGIALRFAREGAVVVIADIDAPGADAVCEEIRREGASALVIQADVTREADCRRMVAAAVERFGRLDILVNNAGIAEKAELAELEEETWDMIEEYRDIRGVRTHLLRAGAGPPLLYLHGAAPSATWLPVHERLAGRFTVYAPDHPGFGLSERPEWLTGMDDLVLHYADFLAALELERPIVVGHSLGGWIAAELAVFYPNHIGHLVLANAGGLHVEGALIPDLFALSGERLTAAVLYRPEDALRLLPPPATEEERVRRFRDMSTLALLAWNPWFDPKLPRRLGRITSPTLVLWGEHERLISLGHGEAYRDAIPNARLQLLPDCGHMAPLEQPNAFADAVFEFTDA